MSLSIKAESSLITRDELEIVSRTHHPAVHELDDETLADTRRRIRDFRTKERTLTHEMRRSIRGKADSRGASFPGNVEKPARRKQVFAGALKRLNGEVTRRRVQAAQDALKDSARRALALKTKAGRRNRPAPGRTSRAGMTPVESEKRRTTVNPAKVGSVSQATKATQAAKDTRNP